MTVIDVHTHMLNRDWVELLRKHGAPRYDVRKSLDAPEGIFLDGAPFMTPMPGHFDYDERIRRMDEARVDMAIISLTCPNVYWGGEEISLQAARIVNDDMARAQRAHPSRIRWMASLPWEYPARAVAELQRAHESGAVGVMVLANIAGASLTSPHFAPIWQAIDDLALPVLVHPTAPPGTPEMDLRAYNLIASIGFIFDTSLSIARMMFDGFFERYPNLKIIASHAGGALPYLVGRLDQCFDNMNACRTSTSVRPTEFMRHIYYDAVTYRQEALELCVAVGGADRVMYGSDYPHNIGDMKGCLARVDNLSPAQREAVRGSNAARVFKL
ncbi:MAG TPA: amidohydrolase family protein [Roseiflexaceae bacterium]|jgi:aminocarboxymuconate-semialdehyde decarboxylase